MTDTNTQNVPPSQRRDPPRRDRRVRVRIVAHAKTSIPGVDGLVGVGETEAIVYESDLDAIRAKVETRPDAWQEAIASCHDQWRDFLEANGYHREDIEGPPERWPDEAHRLIKITPGIAAVCPEKVFYEMSRSFPDETFRVYDPSGKVRHAHTKSGEWVQTKGGKQIRPTKRGRLPLESVEVLEYLPSPLDEERVMRMEAEAAHADTLATALGDKLADALNRIADGDQSAPRRKRRSDG